MIEELTTTTHTCPHCEAYLRDLGVYENKAYFICRACQKYMSAEVWRRIETKEDAAQVAAS